MGARAKFRDRHNRIAHLAPGAARRPLYLGVPALVRTHPTMASHASSIGGHHDCRFPLLAIAALNYHYTGFPSDMAVVQFWPYADLTKIMHWGTMLEILVHHRDLTYIFAAQQPISWDLMGVLAKFLRLDLWWPVFVAGAPFILLRLGSRDAIRRLHAREIDAKACVALSWFCAAVILVAIFGGGRSQIESFYRISTFSYAPTLCLGLLLCQLGLPDAASDKKRSVFWIFPISGMLALAASAILTLAPGS